MADYKLVIENPIETVVSRGASPWSMKSLRFSERRFSLLVDLDCESVITLLIVNVIARKQQLAELQTRLLQLLSYCLTFCN